MYVGLIEFLSAILKSGKSAQIEYMGIDRDGRGYAMLTEKIRTITHDCVILAGKRDVCIPYHAICRVEGITDEEREV